MPMCIVFSSVVIETTLTATQIGNLQPIKKLPTQSQQQKHQKCPQSTIKALE